MLRLRNACVNREACRVYSSANKKPLSIDAGKLEFSKRNSVLTQNLPLFYPSLSSLKLNSSYRPITLEKFHQDYVIAEKGPIDDTSNLLYVNGRIKNIRFSGKKICFIDIYSNQNNVKMQLILNCNRLSAEDQIKFQSDLEFLKNGDYIQGYGFPSYSKSKARTMSLSCTKLPTILAAAQQPLPPKLTDATKKKSNRVVDYQINGVDTLLLRHSVMRSLRKFFDSRGFIEVETPILSSKSNGAAAEAFKTVSNSLPKNANTLELRVAPELWLKRLIISGFDKVYEIGKVFRNEGIDATHNPEFTTLEFYQSFVSMGELIETSEQIFKAVLSDISQEYDNEHVRQLIKTLSENNWRFKRVEFLPTLEKELDIDFSKINLGNPAEIYNALPDNIDLPQGLSSQQLLNKLSSQFIEPIHCHTLLPTVVYHHPTVMSPLAKTDASNINVTKRFEIFINGQEYINAYEEENCPQSQLSKFEKQQEIAKRYDDKECLSIDHEYVEAMKWGMPPIGGFGLGIDRLCMLLSNKKRLEEVISFGCLDDVNRQ